MKPFYDDRTVEEQLRDLGVEVVKKNAGAVTGVRWMQKNPKRQLVQPALTVGKQKLYFNVKATKELDLRNKRFDFGTGNYQGKRVIVLRENECGYKITVVPRGGCITAVCPSKGLMQQLAAAGIGQGRYILYKIKGGYMGVLAE